MTNAISRLLVALSVGTGLLFSAAAQAELPADVQARVDSYKKKLVAWAADPAVVKAVAAANEKGGVAGMNNAKWEELADDDAAVQSTIKAPICQQLRQWEEDKGINKLYLRDQKGNVVAGVARTLLYNASSRPHIAAALKGEVAQGKDVKPDPSTQVKSVQLAVPVLDGGKTIGVMHTAVTAQ